MQADSAYGSFALRQVHIGLRCYGVMVTPLES